MKLSKLIASYCVNFVKLLQISTLLSVLVLSMSLSALANDHDDDSNSLGCPLQKIGYITNNSIWRDTPDFLFQIEKYFPAELLVHVDINPNNTLSADLRANEMERVVNEMKALGIKKIIVAAFSDDTSLFINGNASNLGGIPSDIRHPDVTFGAIAQGTALIDDAQNWLRTGADFVTDATVGPLANLPTVPTGSATFILATDDSDAVRDAVDVPYQQRAVAAGYNLVTVNLGWNDITNTFDNVQDLEDAIALATTNSGSDVIVGISMTTAAVGGVASFRQIDFTDQAKSATFPGIYDPSQDNVSYLSLGYVPLELGVDQNNNLVNIPATIAVDLNYGALSVSEMTGDPKGVNKYLLKVGFPDNRIEAEIYNSPRGDRDGNGAPDGSFAGARWLFSSYAFFSTCAKRNLDNRYLIDATGNRVEFYVEDNVQLAGTIVDDRIRQNLRTNPRWCATLENNPGITMTKGYKKYCE